MLLSTSFSHITMVFGPDGRLNVPLSVLDTGAIRPSSTP